MQRCYKDNLSPATFPPLALKQQRQPGTIKARVGLVSRNVFVKLGYVGSEKQGNGITLCQRVVPDIWQTLVVTAVL